jgi:hypothetical protein
MQSLCDLPSFCPISVSVGSSASILRVFLSFSSVIMRLRSLLGQRFSRRFGQSRMLSAAAKRSLPYLGLRNTTFTNEINFTPQDVEIPVYRVLDTDGQLIDSEHEVKVGISVQ